MGNFRHRCNFLTFCFSEKLFWLKEVPVWGRSKRTFQHHWSTLTWKDPLITSVTLGSFLFNFFWDQKAFILQSRIKNQPTTSGTALSLLFNVYNMNCASMEYRLATFYACAVVCCMYNRFLFIFIKHSDHNHNILNICCNIDAIKLHLRIQLL